MVMKPQTAKSEKQKKNRMCVKQIFHPSKLVRGDKLSIPILFHLLLAFVFDRLCIAKHLCAIELAKLCTRLVCKRWNDSHRSKQKQRQQKRFNDLSFLVYFIFDFRIDCHERNDVVDDSCLIFLGCLKAKAKKIKKIANQKSSFCSR
jgi:hypothetical protein